MSHALTVLSLWRSMVCLDTPRDRTPEASQAPGLDGPQPKLRRLALLWGPLRALTGL
jgi:hypothetical protein